MASVGAVAEGQSQCVHKNRFTRPCFAGHDAQTWLEFDLDLIDYRVVSDFDQAQH